MNFGVLVLGKILIAQSTQLEREHKQTERNGKEGRNKKKKVNKNNNRSRRKRIKKKEKISIHTLPTSFQTVKYTILYTRPFFRDYVCKVTSLLKVISRLHKTNELDSITKIFD